MSLKQKIDFIDHQNAIPFIPANELTLKDRSLVSLIRDSPNDEVVRIYNLIKSEFQNRATPQEVIIFDRKKRYWTQELPHRAILYLFELGLKKYIKDNYPKIKIKDRTKLARYGALYLINVEEPLSRKEMKKLERVAKPSLSEEDMDEFIHDIQSMDDYDYYFEKYFEDKFDNPFIIRALKKVKAAGEDMNGFDIYTINVPLAHHYVWIKDDKFGYYPKIVEN